MALNGCGYDRFWQVHGETRGDVKAHVTEVSDVSDMRAGLEGVEWSEVVKPDCHLGACRMKEARGLEISKPSNCKSPRVEPVAGPEDLQSKLPSPASSQESFPVRPTPWTKDLYTCEITSQPCCICALSDNA